MPRCIIVKPAMLLCMARRRHTSKLVENDVGLSITSDSSRHALRPPILLGHSPPCRAARAFDSALPGSPAIGSVLLLSLNFASHESCASCHSTMGLIAYAVNDGGSPASLARVSCGSFAGIATTVSALRCLYASQKSPQAVNSD